MRVELRYLNVQEISKGDDDLLDLLSEFTCGSKDQGLALLDIVVDLLEDTDGERGRLARAGLGLGDDIAVLEDRHDGALLDGGRTLKTLEERLAGAETTRWGHRTIGIDAS
jgi:hypothetical protein